MQEKYLYLIGGIAIGLVCLGALGFLLLGFHNRGAGVSVAPSQMGTTHQAYAKKLYDALSVGDVTSTQCADAANGYFDKYGQLIGTYAYLYSKHRCISTIAPENKYGSYAVIDVITRDSIYSCDADGVGNCHNNGDPNPDKQPVFFSVTDIFQDLKELGGQ